MARALNRLQAGWTAENAVLMTLRMAATPLAGVRVPPHARKIPTVRRRLPITIFPLDPQPVVIRHAFQNVGSPVSETRPTQSLPV